MKTCLVIILTLYLAGKSEAAVNCFSCTSFKNWDECNDWTQVTCQGDQNRCTFIHFKQGTLDTYYRDCATESFCENKPPCKDPKLDKCEIKCCEKNLCNTKTPSFKKVI